MRRTTRSLSPFYPTCESLEPRALLNAGDLDTTFSDDGRTTVSFPGPEFVIDAVAVQPDGKVVLAGYRGQNWPYTAAVARLNVDGSVDTSFGQGGLFEFVNVIRAYGLALQDDGRIVVAVDYDQHFGVARLLPGGSLDPTFDGDGIRRIPLGNSSHANAVAVQQDGKIVAAGSMDDRFLGLPDWEFVVARLNPDGSLDQGFDVAGGAGVNVFGMGDSEYEAPYAVAVDEQGTPQTNEFYGTIVLAGTSGSGVFAVARLTPDGVLDNGFDNDGRVRTGFPGKPTASAEGIVIQSGGRVVVGGTASPNAYGQATDFAMTRYLPNGDLDTTFGPDGTGRVVTDAGGLDWASGLVESDMGGLLLGGRSGGNFGVAAYTPNGARESHFGGGDGIATFPAGVSGVYEGGIAAGPGRQVVIADGIGNVARFLDLAPVIQIAPSDANLSEAGPNVGSFYVSRHQIQPTPLRVFLSVGGTATRPGTVPPSLVDWSGFAPFNPVTGEGGYVDIPAGQQAVTVTITPVNDTRAEGDETAVFTVLPGDAYDVGLPSAVTLTIRDDEAPGGAPKVSDVFLNGSAWPAEFRNYLQAQGLGDAAAGFRVGAGADQLLAVPWSNVDTVSVRFSQDVVVDQGDMQFLSGAGIAYGVAAGGFSYTAATRTATWRLDKPLADFSATNRQTEDPVRFVLEAGAAGVRGAVGNLALDGDWADGVAAFPSGNGVAGGNFRFLVNAVPGDANRNGNVAPTDFGTVRSGIGRSTADVGTAPNHYTPFKDVNANGNVGPTDLGVVRGQTGANITTVPQPAAPLPRPTWTASSRATRDVLFGEEEIL